MDSRYLESSPVLSSFPLIFIRYKENKIVLARGLLSTRVLLLTTSSSLYTFLFWSRATTSSGRLSTQLSSSFLSLLRPRFFLASLLLATIRLDSAILRWRPFSSFLYSLFPLPTEGRGRLLPTRPFLSLAIIPLRLCVRLFFILFDDFFRLFDKLLHWTHFSA